ncbi:MAG: M61 family metallopeptidase [Bacteroidota bacterium]
MRYTFSIPQPFERFAKISFEVSGPFSNGELELVLPSWRPGRYEMGHFARNIRAFRPFDVAGNLLEFKKISKDRWVVFPAFDPVVRIEYEYYSNQPDAGACFVDHEQLYINPVHCCFFIPGRESEPCEVVLDIPDSWRVATGLQKQSDRVYNAKDFDTLVDSPFIASANLQHGGYVLDGVEFNIWFNGVCNPDWSRIIPDFEAFTRVQLDMMEAFPTREFHFLVQMLPYRFYHGVEHLNSTVLALGPGSELMQEDHYKELLGVASHELFHCWNVKSIRPIEMMPYDYTKENYSRSGYVYEGVTTYYGDLILGRSKFFSKDQMLAEFTVRLQRHMDNPGRLNHSVAESSFDTWLDGYVPGIPGRKVSIYDEGCLVAWMLDFMIRSETSSDKSLDDVMIQLHNQFGMKGRGYSESDFRMLCEKTAGREFGSFFENVIYAPNTMMGLLAETISLAGLRIERIESSIPFEKHFGLRLSGSRLKSVFPGSPAYYAGLVMDDEILEVNGALVIGDPNALVEKDLEVGTVVRIVRNSFGKIRACELKVTEESWYPHFRIVSEPVIADSQLRFRQSWMGR